MANKIKTDDFARSAFQQAAPYVQQTGDKKLYREVQDAIKKEKFPAQLAARIVKALDKPGFEGISWIVDDLNSI